MLLRVGVDVILVEPGEGDRPHLGQSLRELGKRGITRLLVEGGGHLAAALLRENLVDRIAWFRAPTVLGGDGLPVAAAFGIDKLTEAPRFEHVSRIACGDDTLETFARQA